LGVGDAQHGRLDGGGPAHDRPQSRHQLAESERLHEIVIAPEVEPAHAVLDAVTRGQEEHRRRTVLANPPQHGPTVRARQVHVENHSIVFARHREVAPVDPVGRHVDDEAQLHQPLSKVRRGLRIILDDEYAHSLAQMALFD